MASSETELAQRPRPLVAYSDGVDMRSAELDAMKASFFPRCSKCNEVLRSNNVGDMCPRCRRVEMRAEGGAGEDLVRHCAKCGKTLRSNNTKDTCMACRGSAVSGEPSAAPSQESSAAPASSSTESLDTVARFRQAAVLFGLNPDEMIADYCRGWLEAVSSAAKRRR